MVFAAPLKKEEVKEKFSSYTTKYLKMVTSLPRNVVECVNGGLHVIVKDVKALEGKLETFGFKTRRFSSVLRTLKEHGFKATREAQNLKIFLDPTREVQRKKKKKKKEEEKKKKQEEEEKGGKEDKAELPKESKGESKKKTRPKTKTKKNKQKKDHGSGSDNWLPPAEGEEIMTTSPAKKNQTRPLSGALKALHPRGWLPSTATRKGGKKRKRAGSTGEHPWGHDMMTLMTGMDSPNLNVTAQRIGECVVSLTYHRESPAATACSSRRSSSASLEPQCQEYYSYQDESEDDDDEGGQNLHRELPMVLQGRTRLRWNEEAMRTDEFDPEAAEDGGTTTLVISSAASCYTPPLPTPLSALAPRDIESSGLPSLLSDGLEEGLLLIDTRDYKTTKDDPYEAV